MKKYLIIVADTNDGDYVTSKNEITDEQIELIKPVIEAIKNFKPYIGTQPDYWNHLHGHNYTTQECTRLDLGELSAKSLYGNLEGFELFDEFCPFDEYGIHTIESVTILVVEEEIKLL
jgi:hypothetical protein